MRLLLVHNDYRSAEPSGENQVVQSEAAELSSRGHEVTVWGPSSDEIADFTPIQRLMLPARVVWSASAARDLARAIDGHQPDLVHIHNTFPLVSASILGVLRARPIPAVATLHNYRLLCAGGSLFRAGRVCHDCLPSSHLPGVLHGCYRSSRLATAPIALANALYQREWKGLDALLTLSAAQRALFLEAGFDPERVIVKPNFVAEVLDSQHPGPPGDGFVYAGRLAETKGLPVIIQAWEHLASRGVHPPLTIVGSGPLAGEVERFAASHPSVRAVGSLPRSECFELFRGCRAVLAPSTWEETFGLVVVEAMMFGRAAVASSIGSFPDLIDHGEDGLLVPPGDAAALAGAVESLHVSKEMASRLGAVARRTYEGRFRAEPNIELLESVYPRGSEAGIRVSQFGFACLWDDPRSPTWSYIGWSLLRALEAEVAIDDLGPDPGGLARWVLKVSNARWTGEGRVSLWRSSSLAHRYVSRVLDRRCRDVDPEAVIEMTDLWDAPVPFFTYRDVSWDQLSHLADDGFDLTMLGHPGFTRRRLEVVRARENHILHRAAGAIVFSQWAGRHLVEEVGLQPERVHVVPPGASAHVPARDAYDDGIRLSRRRSRLLFVGRDFSRKAGELTVEAFTLVRKQLPDCTLTVVGPDRWPMRGGIPDGVEFRRRIPMSETGGAFLDHDLFVMPSWFEPFGIAFSEALNVGMPCIGRNAFAMPEIVDHGRTGLLTSAESPKVLADVICEALHDDALFESTASAAAEARDHFSWARAGAEIGGLLRGTVAAG